MNTPTNNGAKPRKLATISQIDLPVGRKGKHHPMVVDVLEALQHLDEGRAIKVPLADYPGSVADIRSAIHRATQKLHVEVVTSSDEDFFYIWKPGWEPAAQG